MTKSEFAYLVGELIFTEVDDVAKVEYEEETEQAINFTVKMENGKKFTFNIKETDSRNT